MSEQTIDRLARTIALRGTRRNLLAGAIAAAGALMANRVSVSAQQCANDADCTAPFTCQEGFCLPHGCSGAGGGCTGHTDCCEGSICQGGICAVSARCGREDELCGNGCCPGLICAAGGYCAVEPPAPPENSGGSSGGGGNSGGGGGSNSGGSGGGSGSTSGGVVVASLPSTGSGASASGHLSPALLTAASAVGLAAIAERLRTRLGNAEDRD